MQGKGGTVGIYAGIDVGSSYAKVVLMNETNAILAEAVEPMGISYSKLSEKMLGQILQKNGVDWEDLTVCVSTGYGRKLVPFASYTKTEISCHAKAVHWLYPSARLVIDIGGQDSKVIVLDENGHVVNFLMNDKCAAGTGRFLEVMARVLGIEFSQMNAYGVEQGRVAHISSVCTVFAESEVISMLASGYTVDEIVRGIYESIAARIRGLASRAMNGVKENTIVLSGGANKNPGLIKELHRALGMELIVPKNPQMMGALGAALSAVENC